MLPTAKTRTYNRKIAKPIGLKEGNHNVPKWTTPSRPKTAVSRTTAADTTKNPQ